MEGGRAASSGKLLERQGSAAGLGSQQQQSLSMCSIAFYDDWQVWQFLERYIRAQLPLRDVAWRVPVPAPPATAATAAAAAPTTTLVTISTLPIQVLEHDHALFRNLDPAKNGYRAPYAHVNFVVCETSEAYKGTIKAKVKAWVDERTEKGEEWLLLYVPVGTQNNTHETYLKIYSRLAADFCSKTAGDRSCMLTLFEGGVQGPLAAAAAAGGAGGGGGGAGGASARPELLMQQHQEQWGDVLAKIKTVVGNSFIARCKAFQEEVRKLEEGRAASSSGAATTAAPPSADDAAFFFRLFFAKESLALMSEQLQLPADALSHYQELAALASRWQHLLPALSGSGGGEDKGAPSSSSPPRAVMVFQRGRAGLPVLTFPVFEFRVKLEGGEVGLLEVQQYLFAREASFLQQLGRYPDLFRRSQAFVLQQFQALCRLPPAQVECAYLWAFASAWNVVQAWEAFARHQQQQAAAASASPTPASSSAAPQHQPQPSLAPPPPMSVPQPDLRKQPSGSTLPGLSPSPAKVILLDPALMARHLAELVDFCRLRFLDLGLARLGPDTLLRASVVCAARRDTSAPTLPPSSTGAKDEDEEDGGRYALAQDKRLLQPACTTLEEVDALLRSGAGSSSSSLSSSSSASLDASSGAGSKAGDGLPRLELEDPRHVALAPAALMAQVPWLREALASVAAFDGLYLRMTDVLVRYLERSGRERFLARVQTERAAVLLKLGEAEEARKVLKALAEQSFRKDFWVPLLSEALRRLALCERARGNARAYVGALLQVLSLQSLDEAAGDFFLRQVDEYVRHPSLGTAAPGGQRMVKPLGLLVMARVKKADGGGSSSSGKAGALSPSSSSSSPPPPPRVELGSAASVTLWLNNTLRQPLRLDGLTLVLGEVVRLRRSKQLGADMGWLQPVAEASPRDTTTDLAGTAATAAAAAVSSPRSPQSPRRAGSSSGALSPRSSRSPRGTLGATGLGEEAQAAAAAEYLHWRVEGPLVLEPGVNEVELTTAALPPPGTYVFERLLLRWGGLTLEQEQLAALDADTADLVTKNRPPPRRFSALAKAPARRAVAFTVAARPPATSLALLTSPVLPPDPQHVHHLSVLLDTRTDTLTDATLTVVLSPPALAVHGPAKLAFYPEQGAAGNDHDDDDDPPLREETADVAWDGAATATINLPAEIPPRTSLIVTMPLQPLAHVADSFARGRQDYQLPVCVLATLSAEFNRDVLVRGGARAASADAGAGAGAGAGASSASPAAGQGQQQQPAAAADDRRATRRLVLRPATGAWGHEALDAGLRRTALTASASAVIQQPFSVTISVQGCSHWRASRRYFVQALLRSRAPIAVTLHDCQLRLPPSYRVVQDGGGAHMRDVGLQPGQDVRYTYLIERLPSGSPKGASAAAASSASGRAPSPLPPGRELPSKMSVSAGYTWESLLPLRQARLKRHHPPQQQQSFERYFQDSAMLNRGDALRTFVVHAQLVPTTAAAAAASAGTGGTDDADEEAGAAASPSSTTKRGGGRGLLPASAPATPGDVEERGVVVGHFQNRVTEGLVGVAMRMELRVTLSEEALREARQQQQQQQQQGKGQGAGAPRRNRFRLAYEVAADPADWAVAGLAKGTLDVPVPASEQAGGTDDTAAAVLECKLVPVRTGLLACPALVFDPVDVRQAVSPKSKGKSNVRWVGPRDIQVLSGGGLKRIPTVRIA